jgi:hypothetical protein
MWPSGDRRKVLGPTLCFFFDKISKADQIRGVSIEMKQLGVEDAKLLFHLIILICNNFEF